MEHSVNDNTTPERIAQLLFLQLQEPLSAAEQQELDQWQAQSPEHREAVKALTDTTYLQQELQKLQKLKMAVDKGLQEKGVLSTIEANKLLADSRKPQVHKVHFLRRPWLRYAAAIVVLLGGIGIVWKLSRPARNEGAVATTDVKAQEIQPGGNKAILTIDNRSINLSNNKTGIAVDAYINYTDGERIATAGQMLALSTPRGGQYQAVLPDGSKAWLNAASSIRFPSQFTGNTREVEITGEVYLEVTKNPKRPFIVHTSKTTIQVLGTRFNVNAYEDENMEKTTLIEGSVRLTLAPLSSSVAGISPGRNTESIVLKPDQQAIIETEVPGSAQDYKIKVINRQSEAAIAWKNGLFDFTNQDLPTVMRQLERWYDIRVRYQGAIPVYRFKGKMDRSLDLPELLEALSAMGIKYRLEQRILIIL